MIGILNVKMAGNYSILVDGLTVFAYNVINR